MLQVCMVSDVHVVQAGLRMHTYPRTLFQLANHTSEGLDCIQDKPPIERQISFGSASSTLGDAEEVCLTQMAPQCGHAESRRLGQLMSMAAGHE